MPSVISHYRHSVRPSITPRENCDFSLVPGVMAGRLYFRVIRAQGKFDTADISSSINTEEKRPWSFTMASDPSLGT